jgi:hypothetical protein
LGEINLRIGRAFDLMSDINYLSKKMTIRKRVVGYKKETWLSSEYTKIGSRCKFLVDFKMDWSFNFAPIQWTFTNLFGKVEDSEIQLQNQLEEIILSVEPQFDRLSRLCRKIDSI